jgi:predicted Ser/Thr protein kinase
MAVHPDKVGRYEILEVAGQGAMGVVYKAKDPLIGRIVAIKVMSAAVALRPDEQEEYRQRFFREAQAAGKLRHDNIVSIYDMGEENGVPYMTMEFIEGQSLSKRLKDKGPLPLSEAVSIMRQVAMGLSYAHEQGIVHRDVKPDNILIESKGRAVVTDFGIARLSMSELTRTGEVLGTPHFMSPEQVLGEPVDGRSDLFSLGVIFYLMLSGQRPFVGDTVSAICYHIVHSPAKPLPENLSFPPAIRSLLDRLLAKSKEDRFATDEDLIVALDQLFDQTLAAQSPPLVAGAGVRPVTGIGTRPGTGIGTRPVTGIGTRPGTAIGTGPPTQVGTSPPGTMPGAAPPGAQTGAGTGKRTAVLPPPKAPSKSHALLFVILGMAGVVAFAFALIFVGAMIHGYQKAKEKKKTDQANQTATKLQEARGPANTLEKNQEGQSPQGPETGGARTGSEGAQGGQKGKQSPFGSPQFSTEPTAPHPKPNPKTGIEPPPNTAETIPPPFGQVNPPVQESKPPKGEMAHVNFITEGWMPKVEFLVTVNGEQKIHDMSEGGHGPGQKAGFRFVEHLNLPPGEYDFSISLQSQTLNPFVAEQTLHYRLERGQILALKIEPRRFPNRLMIMELPPKGRPPGG